MRRITHAAALPATPAQQCKQTMPCCKKSRLPGVVAHGDGEATLPERLQRRQPFIYTHKPSYLHIHHCWTSLIGRIALLWLHMCCLCGRSACLACPTCAKVPMSYRPSAPDALPSLLLLLLSADGCALSPAAAVADVLSSTVALSDLVRKAAT